MGKLKNYFGIDFGTTNSATVGYSILNQSPKEIKYGDEEGRPVPSVVAIDKNTGQIYTGRTAWEKRIELSETCEYIPSVKTILDTEWEKEICGRVWTPTDIAAEVFKALKNTVKERTGADMESAIVAIPIGFNPSKRKRLREAAAMAGIRITSFVSEPTAAFFANYQDLKSDSIVAIFDWGGGTLDVSVLQHTDGKVAEIATSGMNVAGDDIDKKIAQRIHSKIARKKGIELRFDDMPADCKDMLLVRAERAKRALYDDDTATISINNYGKFGAFRETLDYDWFAEIINPEIERAIECLNKAIDNSKVGLANIDRIVMVGGSSNLRPLLDRMEQMFSDKLYFPEETMWNVGQGTGRLSMHSGEYYANQYVGIRMSDGSLFTLLEPDTLLRNWSVKHNFGIVDSSKEARFVFGGSIDIEESSDRYKTLSIPAYRFLQEQITVEAMVSEDLIFTFSAVSNMQPEEFRRYWDYSRLKCYYKLPEGGEM